MKKILVAIDGSEGSLRAVDYVGKQFTGLSDLQITLFHVSPGVPPELWDDGHILNEEEKVARKKVLDKWLSNQKFKLESIFQPAVQKLTKGGIEPQQIETKLVSESVKNTAECILAEAKSGGYQTLIMGRCDASPTTHTLLGSTVNKIIHRGAGVAICLVE
jgi:nucleotide-binding universal stress UspA family protein